MVKYIFLALSIFLMPVKSLQMQSLESNEAIVTSIAIEELDEEKKIPAKEAHEKPQKSVNVILIIIFIIAAAAFTAIGIVMRKSEK